MKTLKRFTQSITASVDWMISQVENHEGLVNAAITEVQEAGARAQVQLKRVKNDGQLMRKRLIELREQKIIWEERACKIAGADEKRALECMKRRKKIESDLSELEIQEREHTKIEKQLVHDLVTIQDKLSRLKQQRNVMRTRQSRAEALKMLQSEDRSILTEIDEIFERWDHKVTEYEGLSSQIQSTDDFAEEFTSVEQEEDLKASLSELLQKEGNH